MREIESCSNASGPMSGKLYNIVYAYNIES